MGRKLTIFRGPMSLGVPGITLESLPKSQLADRSGVSYTDTGTPGFLLPSSILEVSVWNLFTRVVEFEGLYYIPSYIGIM